MFVSSYGYTVCIVYLLNIDRIWIQFQNTSAVCVENGSSIRWLVTCESIQERKASKCDMCGAMFSQKSGKREKLFACTECGKSFSHQSSMQNHMLTDAGEKPHKCDLCGAMFTGVCSFSLNLHSFPVNSQKVGVQAPENIELKNWFATWHSFHFFSLFTYRYFTTLSQCSSPSSSKCSAFLKIDF